MSHTTDKALINRLRRANGHLTSIITMIEEDRNALAIAQQMQAVISALEKAKVALVTDHIEHHLVEVVGPLDPKVREQLGDLAALARYL